MKKCRKGHKTQKRCIKISKIRLKEVIFTVLNSKARILRRLCKILRRHALSVCRFLETLETRYWVFHPVVTAHQLFTGRGSANTPLTLTQFNL